MKDMKGEQNRQAAVALFMIHYGKLFVGECFIWGGAFGTY